MDMTMTRIGSVKALICALMLLGLGACAGQPELPAATGIGDRAYPDYRIGPGDSLRIFVWGNPGLSDTVTVRPDGKISIPLIEDLEVTDKTPTEVGRLVEARLGQFVQDPLVTIIITAFIGPFNQQVRVVGAAAEPSAISYRAKLTALDVMIEVGGLTEFAAGNRTILVRREGDDQAQYRVRLDDLIKDGDISANVEMRPGDILIIPESFF